MNKVQMLQHSLLTAHNVMISYFCCSELCAGIVLNCLFCRFYDLFLMLPETCERAAISICPTYMLFSPPAEPAHTNWNCSCDFDCGLRDICHETGECLELAMEISEVCYHQQVPAKLKTSKLLRWKNTLQFRVTLQILYQITLQSMPKQTNRCPFRARIIKLK